MTAHRSDWPGRAFFAMPGVERREGQPEMADAVHFVLSEGSRLVVSAPTGVGKTLAYLVPLARTDFSRMTAPIIATSTKALQDQIWRRDLDMVRAAGMDLCAERVMGIENYVCLRRAGKRILGQPQKPLFDDRALGPAGSRRLGVVDAIIDDTATGLRSDLSEAFSPEEWRAISSTSAQCRGSQCADWGRCFWHNARECLSEASDLPHKVIVVNHHVLARWMIAGVNDRGLGVERTRRRPVVLDECHDFARTFASAMSCEIPASRLREAAEAVTKLIGRPAEALLDLADHIEAVPSDKTTRLPQMCTSTGEDDLASLLVRAYGMAKEATQARGQRDDDASAAAADTALEALHPLISMKLGRVLSWADNSPSANRRCDCAHHARSGWYSHVEQDGPGTRGLRRLVVSPGPAATRAGLAAGWAGGPVVAVTASGDPPELADQLGLLPSERDDARSHKKVHLLRVGAAALEAAWRRSLLYVAADLSEPSDPGWAGAACEELERLVRASGGGTLALFTSWRMVDQAAAHLADAERRSPLGFAVHKQGHRAAESAARAFRDDPDSVLLATAAMWQGADFPGGGCRQVVIDRLPFPRPDDAELAPARIEAGEDAWDLVDLPATARRLAQGVGRLVRSPQDEGVVAVLDQRLATRRYSRRLRDALPPMRRCKSFATVDAYWQDRRPGRAAA